MSGGENMRELHRVRMSRRANGQMDCAVRSLATSRANRGSIWQRLSSWFKVLGESTEHLTMLAIYSSLTNHGIDTIGSTVICCRVGLEMQSQPHQIG